jgi:hypothetical protein
MLSNITLSPDTSPEKSEIPLDSALMHPSPSDKDLRTEWKYPHK